MFLKLTCVAVAASILLLTGCTKPPNAPGEIRQAVLMDVDGTLSRDTLDLLGTRPFAQDSVRAYLDLGYEVVLLTARPSVVEIPTTLWLSTQGFPDVPIYFADRLLIAGAETRRYKRDAIWQIEDELGLEFVLAYGDSPTDFDAYEEAGLDPMSVFALLRQSDSDCQPGAWAECLPGWEDHLDFIDALPPANP
ncbi:MAG: hypothetical protein GY937_09145 [bacterium]|nr:hypothetical protein [bacterium]